MYNLSIGWFLVYKTNKRRLFNSEIQYFCSIHYLHVNGFTQAISNSFQWKDALAESYADCTVMRCTVIFHVRLQTVESCREFSTCPSPASRHKHTCAGLQAVMTGPQCSICELCALSLGVYLTPTFRSAPSFKELTTSIQSKNSKL